MFIDSRKVTYIWGKETPVMTNREELKNKQLGRNGKN